MTGFINHPGLGETTRVYLFRADGCSYVLVVNSDLNYDIFKIALPAAGLGRAAVVIAIEDCPEDAAMFFRAILDGEKLRDEFEKRGAY